MWLVLRAGVLLSTSAEERGAEEACAGWQGLHEKVGGQWTRLLAQGLARHLKRTIGVPIDHINEASRTCKAAAAGGGGPR